MRMGLRYGLSLIMLILGVYVIYNPEILALRRGEGLVFGSILIVWALVCVLMWKRLEKRMRNGA